MWFGTGVDRDVIDCTLTNVDHFCVSTMWILMSACWMRQVPQFNVLVEIRVLHVGISVHPSFPTRARLFGSIRQCHGKVLEGRLQINDQLELFRET